MHPPRVRPLSSLLALLLGLLAVTGAAPPLRAQQNPVALAVQLNREGARAYEAGQFDRALSYFQRTLEIFQSISDVSGTASALANLAMVQGRLGQHKKALEHLERALALIDERKPEQFAGLLSKTASAYISLGQPQNAIRYLERSLEINRALESRTGVMVALDGLAHAYLRLGQFDRALATQEQVLAIVRPSGDLREIARILGNIGATAKGKGDYKLAVSYLDESMRLKRQFAPREELAAGLSNLALIHFDQTKLPEASAAFAECILIHEAVSQEVREASKVGDYQDMFRSSLYRRYAHALINQGKHDDALAVLERGRNQGLGRQAAQNRADYSRFLGAADARRLQAAITAFSQAGEAMRQTEGLEFLADGAGPSPEKQQLLTIRRRYDDAERNLALLRQQLAAKSPAYRRRSGTVPPTIAEMKELAAKTPDTLYLQWAVGAEATSLLFALSQKTGVQTFVLPSGEAKIRGQVDAWRQSIERQDARMEQQHARSLYETLFSSVEQAGLLAPGQFSRLVLVGDGPLLTAPHAALLNAKGERLIDRFPIAVSSSFAVLAWPDERGKADAPIFVVADPLAPGVPPLPAARAEGQSVAQLFPGAKLLVGNAAVRAQVLPQLAKHSVLHFATHGLFDDKDGLKSGLLLATERGGGGEQLLEARELLNMQLAAQLAVLSACDTGQGQKAGGEGILGLTWAFRAAGCPSVVASLWSVDDAATGAMMVKFYEGLKAGKRKDDALREAILTVKQAKPNAFYWAPFQIHGDAGSVKL